MDSTSSFTPSHSIGGINIKTAEDLKNVPLSDIYLYLNNLAYLNSSYASQITLLLEKIENLEASIKDYRELKSLMDELSNGHISLTCKIDLLITEFVSFKIETIQKLYNNHEDIYTLTALNICRKYYEKTFHISDNLEIK